jgi:hypothetical protein
LRALNLISKHSHHQQQEFSIVLSTKANALEPSVFELQYCQAFQRYVQLSLAAGIARSISDIVRMYVHVTGDAPTLVVDNVSNDHQLSELANTLQKLSSKLVSEYIQALCATNFDFLFFITRCCLEHCRASLAIGHTHPHSILSPVAIALRSVLKHEDATCIRIDSTIMKCRAFVSQPDSPFTIVSDDVLYHLTSSTNFHPPQFDVSRFIKIIRALIVAAASDKHVILKEALLFELQQAVYIHGDAIQSTFSLQQEAVALIWDLVSASASFTKLTAAQLANSFVDIVKAIKAGFIKHGMDAARCTDIASLALASTMVVALLKSNDEGSEISAAFAAQLHEKNPEFLKWVYKCLSQLIISKYLDCVPLTVTHKALTYLRCSSPTAASPHGSATKVSETTSHPSPTSEVHSFQSAPTKVEELLWLSVNRLEPFMADRITLDLLEHRSAAELLNDVTCPFSLERSIKQSLNRIHAAANKAPRKDTASLAGDGAVSAAAVAEAQPKSQEAASCCVAPVIGTVCNNCGDTCGVTFYRYQGAARESSSSLKPLDMCLRCVFEDFIPKDSLCNLGISSVLSVSFTQPIFKMALQRSLSALMHRRVILCNGMGSPSVIGAAVESIDLSPQFVPVVMPLVSKFHKSDLSIDVSNARRTATRQRSASHPVVNALPVANVCSFQVIIDSESSCDQMSFGIASSSLPLKDSSGVGPSSGSWGMLSSQTWSSYSNPPSNFFASGSKVAGKEFRTLRKGDRLKGIVNFEQRRFDFFLNDTEVAHSFTIDEHLQLDNCVFALSLPSSMQVTIIDTPDVAIEPIAPREQDPRGFCDMSYVWMQSITQELARTVPPSLCTEGTLTSWINRAMSVAASLFGDGSNSDLPVVSSFRLAVVRNALFAHMRDSCLCAKVAAQLLPSLLSMCEDAVECSAPESASTLLVHFFTCDVAAATFSMDEMQTTTADCIKKFTQGCFARTLKLYVGLHALYKLMWDCLLSTSNHEGDPAISGCMSMYKEHAEFIRGVVCSELFTVLPAVSVAEMMDALGRNLQADDRSKIAESTLLQLFTQQADVREHMCTWTARVITGDALLSEESEGHNVFFREFVLALSRLSIVKPPPPVTRRFICISGTTGARQLDVNGIYDQIDEKSFEQHVYIKRNQPKKCIHFFHDKKPHWVIADVENIGKNSRTCAFLEHNGSFHSAPSLNAWAIYDDSSKSWLRQDSLQCLHFEVLDYHANAFTKALPNTLICPLHQHPLVKKAPVLNGSYTCNLCLGKGSDHAYHCKLCGWDAHPSCALDVSSKQAPSGTKSPLEESGTKKLVSSGASPSQDGSTALSLEDQRSSDSCIILEGCEQMIETDSDHSLPFTLVAAGDCQGSSLVFLQDLHAACFLQANMDDPFTVKSLSSASKSITRFLCSCRAKLSDAFRETLGNICVQAGQHILSKISEQARARLYRSLTNDLLAFGDELSCFPEQNLIENKVLMSFVEVLSPWVPCVRGLSFDHSAVMDSIAKHIGLLQ